MELPNLSAEEIDRYSRHLNLKEVGLAGQQKLKAAKVLVVGAGGLGSPVILYLAAAGVGTIGIVDHDDIELSNLQRQIIYTTDEVGSTKVDVACRKASKINPEIKMVAHRCKLEPKNIMEIIEPYDVIIDGSDNFPSRYLINDACVLLGKPDVFAAIYKFEGQASVFLPRKGPCYRCLFACEPQASEVPNCRQAGVLGVLPGLMGTVQAIECLKLILGQGDSLVGRMLLLDALRMQFTTVKVKPNPACAVCGKNPTITSITNSPEMQTESCTMVEDLSAESLASILKSNNGIVLLDVRELDEFNHSHLPKAIHIPLGELEQRLKELPVTAEIVVYCRSGGRSRRAGQLLQAAGMHKVHNLKGGLRAWSQKVDPEMDVLA